jgi:hypothetical protein
MAVHFQKERIQNFRSCTIEHADQIVTVNVGGWVSWQVAEICKRRGVDTETVTRW